MSHVFISYKSEDRSRVKPLVDALSAEGLEVWWDVRVEGGAAWRETIQAELDAADCVIVVWSEASVGPDGHFVQDEASRANRRGVYLPVAIDAVRPPLGFGQKQVLKLVGWRGAKRDPRLGDVIRAVRAMIDQEVAPSPTIATPSKKFLPRKWRLTGLVAAALVIAAAVVGLTMTKIGGAACDRGGLTCLFGALAPHHAADNSIAVLPFTNLSGDAGQDYFSDGLSEELISALARLNSLQVVARTSSFKFKGSKEDSSTIGSKLGVSYLLDGSVRRDGELVRVTTQLVDAKSGFERWSQSYDRDMKDIFAVQSGIAQAVADALQVRLAGADITALSRGATANPAAYDAFLRGRRLLDAGGGEATYRDALAKFDSAIAADQQFAVAHAARARTLMQLADEFVPANAVRPTAEAALASAKRAVDLAPDLAETQVTLGYILATAKLDFAGAREHFARAMATGSGDANVLARFGLFSCDLGDTDRGLAAVRHATILDPLNPLAFRLLGNCFIEARRYPDAINALRRALELSPKINAAHGLIGDALFLQGQFDAAEKEYAVEPVGFKRLAGLAIVRRRLNNPQDAAAALKALQADANGVTDYQQAEVYAQWGDPDRAFAALDAALKHGDSGLELLKSDPLVDPLRVDARYARLIARLGLDG